MLSEGLEAALRNRCSASILAAGERCFQNLKQHNNGAFLCGFVGRKGFIGIDSTGMFFTKQNTPHCGV